MEQNHSESEFQYFAFISYSSRDEKWAKWLQYQLEYYHMPIKLCHEHPELPKKIRPVFWYKQDLSGTGLTDALQKALHSSRYLIVICSPDAARSPWVNDEVTFFIDNGKREMIIPLIVRGTPHSTVESEEAFPPALRTLSRSEEIRGIDVRPSRKRALVDIVATMFKIRFDELWLRYRRRHIRNTIFRILIIAFICISVGVAWFANQPFNTEITLEENCCNPNLPGLQNSIMTLNLDDEIKSDTILDKKDGFQFFNIPQRFLGKKVPIHIESHGFQSLDTTIELHERHHLILRRAPEIYGKIRFILFDINTCKGIGNYRLEVAGQEVVSGPDGKVEIQVPLINQSTFYMIHSDLQLECDTLFMPCSPNSLIIVK